jgi:hypothetical protein
MNAKMVTSLITEEPLEAAIDDSCSQNSSNSGKVQPNFHGTVEGGVSAIKRVDEEELDEIECDVQKREKDDRNRLNSVRTLFYSLNERFE